MTRRPCTLIWFLPIVQFHMVVQGPFFTEGPLTQVAFKLPAGEGETRRERGEKTQELFTDPKADLKCYKM